MNNRDGTPTSIDDHSGPAGRILNVLERFADQFAERGVPVHFENIAREGKYLKGSKIGQYPERFVETHLIWPALQAFDYEFWAQPHGYPKWDSTRPDFAIQNFNSNIDCAVIGEVKTPNKFEYADEEIKEYLGSDLERATVGFATDGVQWKVHARPEKDPESSKVLEVDLSEAFRRMAARHLEQETYSAHSVRQSMTSVERLFRTNVEDRVAEEFED